MKKRLAVSAAFVIIVALIILLIILFFQSGLIYKVVPQIADLLRLSNSTISKVNETINKTILSTISNG